MRVAVYVKRDDPERAIFHHDLQRAGGADEYEFVGLFEIFERGVSVFFDDDREQSYLTNGATWKLYPDDWLRGEADDVALDDAIDGYFEFPRRRAN